jgi:ClpP class serine protease
MVILKFFIQKFKKLLNKLNPMKELSKKKRQEMKMETWDNFHDMIDSLND